MFRSKLRKPLNFQQSTESMSKEKGEGGRGKGKGKGKR